MNFNDLNLYGGIFIGIGIILSLIHPSRRMKIGGVISQYFGVFIFFLGLWSINLAVVKLVAGWIACAVLALSLSNQPSPTERFTFSQVIFRLLAIFLIGISAFSVSPEISLWLNDAPLIIVWGGVFLIGNGLLMGSLANSILQNILSLLLTLSGFEVLLMQAEHTLFLITSLAMTTLCIGIMGAYFLTIATRETT